MYFQFINRIFYFPTLIVFLREQLCWKFLRANASKKQMLCLPELLVSLVGFVQLKKSDR